MNTREIKERIRSLRQAAGYSQQEIADILDIHVNTYVALEKGDTPIINKHLYSLADACHSTVEEILLGFRPDEKACKELEEMQASYSMRRQNDTNMYMLNLRVKDEEISRLEEEREHLKKIIKEKEIRLKVMEELTKEKDIHIHLLEHYGKDCVTLLDETRDDTAELPSEGRD